MSDSALLGTTKKSRNGEPSSLVNNSAAATGTERGGKDGETASHSKKIASKGADSNRTNRSAEGGVGVGGAASESKKRSSKVSETRSGRDSVSSIEGGSSSTSGVSVEARRKNSKDSDTVKRSSFPDVEAHGDVVAVEHVKKVMPPRSSSEGNITISPKKKLPESSLKESRGKGRREGVSATPTSESTVRSHKKMSGDMRMPSDSNLPSPISPDAPVSRLRSSTTGHTSRPSSAAGGGARKKTTKPVPVARPISAQPSRAVTRRLEEEKEREEREKAAAAAAAEEAMKKQSNQTDGLVAEQVEGGDDREVLSLKESIAPSANGAPQQKKSLPVKN
jgi:hypothetical protein